MRTIGKVYIKKLQQATIAEMKINPGIIDPDIIIDRMPDAMLETWEGAYTEAVRIIDDTISQEVYK